MNRRDIFKSLAVAPLAFLIPAKSRQVDVKELVYNVPGDITYTDRPEMGRAIEFKPDNVVVYTMRADTTHPFRYLTREEWLHLTPDYIRALQAEARRKLPSGSHYEIRGKIPCDFGRRLGVAWYWNPSINRKPLIDHGSYPGVMNELEGFLLIGRYRV